MDETTLEERIKAHVNETVAASETRIMSAIADLRAYVERIEQEANDMMGAMNDPDAMMKMAGKFLGGMG